MNDLPEIKRRLRRQDCTVAENHLDQATSALGRGEWESASGQVRSAVEGLFDRVAELRLKTAKRGGAARKELEAKGVLIEKQARFIQAFMDYAGASGSHAGASTPDEAKGRYIAGLGILMIGLDLLPELTRVEEALAALDHPPSDSEIMTSCRTCGKEQSLAECDVRRDGPDTVYVCCNGCQALVVVSEPGQSPWPGRGYRLGDHVIRNASDLIVAHSETPARVVIPASPAALMKSRPPDDTGHG
jgi:hypothetical protein